MCFSPKSHGQKWLITLNTYFLYSSGYTPVCGLLATTQVYGSWSLRQLLLFTRIPLQVSHYRLFQRTANFFTKPKPCYITILKHTTELCWTVQSAKTYAMCFTMAGDTGLEPVHVGIKIRCLTNLANLQQTIVKHTPYLSLD